MLMHLFATGSGDWDRTAALQQTFVSRALYQDRIQLVRDLFGGDVSILAWQPPASWVHDWTPGYAIFRSGIHYFLNVAGTVSIRQIINHLDGSICLSGQKGGTTWAPSQVAMPNYRWQQAFSELDAQWRAAISPTAPGAKVCVFGHSYGAAVAALAAWRWGVDPGWTMQTLTIASPKIWTVGPLENEPDPYFRIESTNDLVCGLPQGPDWCPIVFRSEFVRNYLYPVQSYLLRWEHKGTTVLLQSDGSEGGETPAPGPLPEFVTNSYYNSHFTANYYGRILANSQRGA